MWEWSWLAAPLGMWEPRAGSVAWWMDKLFSRVLSWVSSLELAFCRSCTILCRFWFSISRLAIWTAISLWFPPGLPEVLGPELWALVWGASHSPVHLFIELSFCVIVFELVESDLFRHWRVCSHFYDASHRHNQEEGPVGWDWEGKAIHSF